MASSLVPRQRARWCRPRCSRARTATRAAAVNAKVNMRLLRECQVHELGLTYPTKDISEIAVEVVFVA